MKVKAAVAAVFCVVAADTLANMPTTNCENTDHKLWLPPGQQQDPKLRGIYDVLAPMFTCSADVSANEGKLNDQIPCGYFVAKALKAVYAVSDFIPSDPSKEWQTANMMISRMSGGGKWHVIGPVNVQANLDKAAKYANEGQAVVAGKTENPHGHVAIVLPGAQAPSSSWKDQSGRELRVPNSASFFLVDPTRPYSKLNNPMKSYAMCRLSAAWRGSELDGVALYYRDKP